MDRLIERIRALKRSMLVSLTEAPAEEIWPHYEEKFKVLGHDLKTFETLLRADPTSLQDERGRVRKVGQYSKWLIRIFLQKKMRLDDVEKASEYLTAFDKHKTKLPLEKRDILKLKSLPDLYELLRAYDLFQKHTDREKKQAESEDYEVFFENENWIVRIPHTHAAACSLGKWTQWCTAAHSEESAKYFQRYSKEGPLYIIRSKLSTEKYQLHFETGQFKSPSDKDVDTKDFFEKAAALGDAFAPVALTHVSEDFQRGQLVKNDIADVVRDYLPDTSWRGSRNRDYISRDFALEVLEGGAEPFSIYETDWIEVDDEFDTLPEDLQEKAADLDKRLRVLDEEDVEDYEFDSSDLHEDLEEVLKQAIVSGYEAGAESDFYNDLVKGIESEGWTRDETGKWTLKLTNPQVIALALGEEPSEDSSDESSSFRILISVPYNGWSGFSKEAFEEVADNRLCELEDEIVEREKKG